MTDKEAQIEKDDDPQEGAEEETASGLIKEWAENSSCNGVPNITRSVHVVRKLAWILLVIGGALATLWQVSNVFEKFFSYPVIIGVNMTHALTLPFPAVTLCNTNIVRKSKLYLVEDVMRNVLPYSFNVSNGDTAHLDTIYKRQEIRNQFDNDWALISEAIQLEMVHQKEDMIIDCSFNGHPCSRSDFSQYINPVYGACYTFNGDRDNIIYSHRPGPLHGLTVELFIEQDEYVPELTEHAGVKVTVHDQNVMPFPEDEGSLAAPDMQTLVGIRLANITRKPAPYPSECWEMTADEAKSVNVYSEIYAVDYSFAACQKSCYQNHVISECLCADPVYPSQGQAVRSALEDPAMTISPCASQTELTCEENVRDLYLNDELECNCSVNCVDVEYMTSQSIGMWPSEDFKVIYYPELANKSERLAELVAQESETVNIAESLVKLKVYYEELNYELISEKEGYSVSNLFSDLGGSIGFYLGISIVAFFEFFELLIDFFIHGMRGLCGKKKVAAM